MDNLAARTGHLLLSAVLWPTVVAPVGADDGVHWSFRQMQRPQPAVAADASHARTPIDRFVIARLAARGLQLNPEADRLTLIRRVSFDLVGLPPMPEEVSQFLSDRRAGAYERMVERYLASPRYGERWGAHWLDTAGYADSNGYFSADTDRPLAWRYRDYVIRSFNTDKPFDQFVREQLAGDELAGYRPGGKVSPRQIELLEATHFLRNAQDGTDSSDGNPDEVRTDKYKALEGTLRIIGSSLLGLKLQCARCHEHKFEPIAQREYYQLQSILYPAFNIENWVNPEDRITHTASPGEITEWEKKMARLDARVSALRSEFTEWQRLNREPGVVVFQDAFEPAKGLSSWSNTVPGDSQPAGAPAVKVGSAEAPGAVAWEGGLRILESGVQGDRAISTRRKFDWTPDMKGAWIQATFELVADRVEDSASAARIGYFIALHDFNDRDSGGGNVLLDGNPKGGAPVHLDYPGSDSKGIGTIGAAGYRPGHRFGVRVTGTDGGSFRLEHLVDGALESKSLTLAAADLPDGGFGFEYCCGRSFVVDNVVIETSDESIDSVARKVYAEKLQVKRTELDAAIESVNIQRTDKPGKLAWVSDLSPKPPDVFLLNRGDYKAHAEKVQPAVLMALSEPGNPLDLSSTSTVLKSTTGRRLAFARWLTRPDSKASALLARVTVNRVWQRHFGTGIVATSDNLGLSGALPTFPKLLEWLASEFSQPAKEVAGDWSLKHLHRLILTSALYRQSSHPRLTARKVDPDNRLLWQYSLRRLDAEAIRDGMLAASGELDKKMGGPYVPTRRLSPSEVVVDDKTAGAMRRSIYLQHRRTQIPNVLRVFDAPSIVFNCTRRDSTTVPLQSLSLLNSGFCRERSKAMAARVQREAGTKTDACITRAFLLAFGRPANADEYSAARAFLRQQPAGYAGQEEASQKTWTDFCQMLLASNAFLYVD